MIRIPSFLRGRFRSEDIGPRYATSRLGQRYATIHGTPGTHVTAQTSWVATTPTFMFYNAGSEANLILSGMTLTQVGVVAGATIEMAILIDTANRYSAAGTAVVPEGMSALTDPVPGGIFRYNPTAAAAAGTHRVVFGAGAPACLGHVSSFDFGDGIMIGRTGSILIYTWAGTTAPTWVFDFETVEESP